MSIADERFAALTTFKRDGTPRTTAIWPVDVGDGRVGLITSSQTWKVKRLANDSRGELQPSDSRGRPKEGSSVIRGTAEVVRGAEFEAAHAKVRNKYGTQLTLINGVHALQRLLRRGGHDNDCAVIVTLDD